MSTEKFDASINKGPHSILSQMAGEWEGTSTIWFEYPNPADVSPVQGNIKPILGGRFMLHEYKGSMNGKPLEGAAIYGYHLADNTYQVAWVDSFHNGTGIMFSEGKKDGPFDVLGSYACGGERWGWRTAIGMNGPDELVITHYNITPAGIEAKGLETVYSRIK